MATKKEKTICGKTEKEIRKAYFERKISDLIADIQGDSKISKSELDILIKLLGDLRTEEKEAIGKVSKEIGFEVLGLSNELKPPSIEDLTKKLTPEESAKFDT